MTRFLLIRHAETEMVGRSLAGRMPGVHLSLLGQEQAEQLALRLNGMEIAALYASPLERATETAAPLARSRKLPVHVSEAMTELDYGEWTGQKIDDLEEQPAWRRFNSHRSVTRIAGGENMLEVQSRAVMELDRLRERYDGSTVAIVSHGDVIRCTVVHYLGMAIDLFQRLEISPASVTTVDLAEWGPCVRGLNAL